MSADNETRCECGARHNETHKRTCVEWKQERFTEAGVNAKASDEPREVSVGWKEHRRTVDPVERARMEAYANVGRLTTDENAPVLAAVLAEVALLKSVGGRRFALGSQPSPYELQLHHCALELIELLRLKSGGAA